MADDDWECPDCGAVVSASKETCFKCDSDAGGVQICMDFKRGVCSRSNCRFLHDGSEDVADVPECADFKRGMCNREHCRFLHGEAGKKSNKRRRQKKKKAATNGTKLVDEDSGEEVAAPVAAATVAAAVTASTIIKSLAKMSPTFKMAWVSYCRAYGKGFSDPSKYDEDYITEFVEYAGGLIEANVGKAGDDGMEAQAQPAAEPVEPAEPAQPAKATNVQPAKRPAEASPAAAAPAGKKKLTIKKSIADEIHRINESGILQVPIRLGAVAGNLGQLGEAAALDALSTLELQQEEIEDPNVFLCSYVPQ